MPTRRILLATATAAVGAAMSFAVTGRADHLDDDDSDEDDIDSYGLDDISREVAAQGRLVCPKVELVDHRGTHLRYGEVARVYTGFQPRLELMEEVAVDVATRFYGRAPRRLHHIGTLTCRRIRGYPKWISEHGLGNAIDLEGFDFAALPKGAELPEGMPAILRHACNVRVLSHWKATRGPAVHHARFLHALADALIARQDIFRVLLGPGYPGHWNHFHLDCAPFRMVEGFEDTA